MWPDRDKLALGWASSFEEYGVPKGVGGGGGLVVLCSYPAASPSALS